MSQFALAAVIFGIKYVHFVKYSDFVLSILGRCSLRVIEALSRFTFELILKIAHFRSLILELSSAVIVPITLGCLVPFYMLCYKYIFTPIRFVINKGL